MIQTVSLLMGYVIVPRRVFVNPFSFVELHQSPTGKVKLLNQKRFVRKSRLTTLHRVFVKGSLGEFLQRRKMRSESVIQRWKIHPACGGVNRLWWSLDNCELTKKPKICEGKNCLSYCVLGKIGGLGARWFGIWLILRKVDHKMRA